MTKTANFLQAIHLSGLFFKTAHEQHRLIPMQVLLFAEWSLHYCLNLLRIYKKLWHRPSFEYDKENIAGTIPQLFVGFVQLSIAYYLYHRAQWQWKDQSARCGLLPVLHQKLFQRLPAKQCAGGYGWFPHIGHIRP